MSSCTETFSGNCQGTRAATILTNRSEYVKVVTDTPFNQRQEQGKLWISRSEDEGKEICLSKLGRYKGIRPMHTSTMKLGTDHTDERRSLLTTTEEVRAAKSIDSMQQKVDFLSGRHLS